MKGRTYSVSIGATVRATSADAAALIVRSWLVPAKPGVPDLRIEVYGHEHGSYLPDYAGAVQRIGTVSEDEDDDDA